MIIFDSPSFLDFVQEIGIVFFVKNTLHGVVFVCVIQFPQVLTFLSTLFHCFLHFDLVLMTVCLYHLVVTVIYMACRFIHFLVYVVFLFNYLEMFIYIYENCVYMGFFWCVYEPASAMSR